MAKQKVEGEKVRVALITPIKGNNLGVGMSKYANVICDGLNKEEAFTCISFSDRKLSNKFEKLANFILPVRAINSFLEAIIKKTEIYHFICPELMYRPFAVFQLFFIKYILNKKIVLTFHDLMTLEESEGPSKVNILVKPLIKKLVRTADKIIVNSVQTGKEILQSLKVPSDKVIVAELGIQSKYHPLKKKRRNILGYFAAFDSVKDPLYAVKCFGILAKKFPGKFQFNLWGKGGEMEKCKEYAKKEKIKKIKFKGYAPEEKVVETYNSFDVYLFPSKYEGFGLNIGEAIACGVPVVIRENARITPELRKLCVVGKDEKDIVEKINKLYENKNYRNKIVKKGLKEIKKFTWKKNLKEHLKVYKKLAHKSK